MIEHTPEELAKLKAEPRVLYLLEFEVGNTTYRFNNGDADYYFGANTYLAGFINEMPDIEITSTPKTNDLNIEFEDSNKVLATGLLSQNWMNKPLKITKLILDNEGEIIISKIAFQGFQSEFAIDADKSMTEETASSIWADFEKQSGIKTNAKSQQRFYPNDTAFEWSSLAINKVYWGKEVPRTQGTSVPSSPYGSPRVEP